MSRASVLLEMAYRNEVELSTFYIVHVFVPMGHTSAYSFSVREWIEYLDSVGLHKYVENIVLLEFWLESSRSVRGDTDGRNNAQDHSLNLYFRSENAAIQAAKDYCDAASDFVVQHLRREVQMLHAMVFECEGTREDFVLLDRISISRSWTSEMHRISRYRPSAFSGEQLHYRIVSRGSQ